MSYLKRVWIAVDGEGGCHGPFDYLAGKDGFVFYAAAKHHPEPWTLLLVDSGDKRTLPEIAIEALAASRSKLAP